MRDYSKVSPKLWRSPRFRALQDDDARYLYVYLLSCEHQTSAGCFRLPDAYAAADLRWTDEKLDASRKSLVHGAMIAHDAATEEYFVLRWFRHNPPTNGKHLKGVQRIISELDSDCVREVAEAELTEHQENRNPLDDVPDPGHRLTSTAYFNGRGR
jgi:hypothetical protein